ncbi:MAG: NAD(P)/FAD-dependent oxidoreductase [Pirellulales bacterium]
MRGSLGNIVNTFDAVVVGGGVAGLSTAMQLASRGFRVVVLERQQLGSGSTGRAAGLLGQLRGTAEPTRMLIEGVKIVRELEERAGVEIYVQTGSVRVAETPERAQEIVQLVDMGKSIGFQIDHVPVDEVARLLPHMKTDDLLAACLCPTDGYLQPAELVAAYTKVGREMGVEFHTRCRVDRLLVEGGAARGVATSQGDFHAAVVVNAGGPWSMLLAETAGVRVPAAAIGHCYLTTTPDGDHPVDRLSPSVRDRHLRIYARPEAGGLIVGMYGEEPPVHDMARLPADFDMATMKSPHDSLDVALLLEAAAQRFPWIGPRTPMHVTTGIMTFTPDAKPLCGKMSNIDGLFHCTGFSGHGIVQSPTIGVIMADLIVDGQSDYDIAAIEADRFHARCDLIDRQQIDAACRTMAGNYYGAVEGKSDRAT